MRFQLVDRVTAVVPGRSLSAVKSLTLGEEYLADHFPGFPVMPGVLMLHALTEAAAWLWRADCDFRFAVAVLREARNVRYGSFLVPGRSLQLEVEYGKRDDGAGRATFKAKATSDGQQVVSAQVTLAAYNLAGRWPGAELADGKLVEQLRERWAWLSRPALAG